jgi:hypothetical protein
VPAVGQLSVVVGAFAGATLLALALGAVNLGTAMGVGQVAFAVALVAVMARA